MTRAWGSSNFEEEKGLTLEKARFLMQVDHTKGDFWELRRLEQELVHNFVDGSERLRCDREVALATVSVRGRLLEFCSPALRGDSEVAFVAASRDSEAIVFVSPELRDDKDFMLKVVHRNGLCLRHASERLASDREVVLEAVNNTGFALRYSSAALRGQKAFVLDVVQCFGYALEYASEELRGDKEVVMVAVRQCPVALRFASSNLRADPDVVVAALLQGKNTPGVLQFADRTVKRNKDLVLLAARYADSHEDANSCWSKADETITSEIPWGTFNQAAKSTLAIPGEEAPVVSVTLSYVASNVAAPSANAEPGLVGSFTCRATLLSGTSFTCELPDRSVATRPDHTLNDLASKILASLPNYVEVKEPPNLFLVVNGDQSHDIVVTAWDSQRSLREFV